jgi:hypothetical protein
MQRKLQEQYPIQAAKLDELQRRLTDFNGTESKLINPQTLSNLNDIYQAIILEDVSCAARVIDSLGDVLFALKKSDLPYVFTATGSYMEKQRFQEAETQRLATLPPTPPAQPDTVVTVDPRNTGEELQTRLFRINAHVHHLESRQKEILNNLDWLTQRVEWLEHNSSVDPLEQIIGNQKI